MHLDFHKHDRFIKAIFSNIDKAREYFENYLPPDLLKQLDLSTLEIANKSFVSEDLKELFADIVFEVKLKNSQSSAYATVLFEHKSSIYKYVTIQKGKYIFSALLEQVKSGVKVLKPIIPVLFNHGKEKWDYHTHRSLYKDIDESILKYIPDYEYVFHNVQSMSDHEILKQNATFWNGILLMLKHAQDEDYLIEQAGVIFTKIEEESVNSFKPAWVYFFSLIKNKSKIMSAIDIMPEPVKGKARNAYEELILEGMEKGIEKGIEKGMERGIEKGMERGIEKGKQESTKMVVLNAFAMGIPIPKIATLVSLPELEVLQIVESKEKT